MSDAKAVLESLNAKLTDSVKADLNAVIGVRLDQTDYTIDARQNGAGLMDGAPEAHDLEPRIAIATSSADFLKLVNGELNPMMAAMTGKLKVSGDMSFAMKLTSLFG
jgi:putative sterol carrier protein